MAKQDPRITALLGVMEQAYGKRGWHGPTLRGALRGVTPKQALWKPSPERNSIPRALHRLTHEVSYLRRRPLPEAAEGLVAIAAVRRPIIVTGRSWLVERSIRVWLAQHGFDRYIEDVVPNNTNLRTAQFKLRIALSRRIEEQVDALARGELAALPLPPEARFAAAKLGAPLELRQALVRRHGECPSFTLWPPALFPSPSGTSRGRCR